MANGYNCPFCRANIGLEDVNAATDIALCRSCGQTSSFASLVDGGAPDMDILNDPPRWISVEQDFGGGTIIRYKKFPMVLLFLIPFTVLWSGLSMGMIYIKPLVEGRPLTSEAWTGIPFAIGTVMLLGAIAFLWLHKNVLTLDHGEGSIFIGIGSLGWTRHFTYNRQTMVAIRMNHSVRVNNMPQQAVLVRTDGKDFMFGSLWKEQAKKFAAAAIMAEVARCR